MGKWVKITEENLATYQAGKLVDAMKTKALDVGQENPIPEAIRVVVEKIRGAIMAGGGGGVFFCGGAGEGAGLRGTGMETEREADNTPEKKALSDN